MAFWTNLKSAINNVIKANNNKDITGTVLQNTLNNLISIIGENATYAGIATTTTSPGTPDGPVFYFAKGKGTYSNFSGIEIKNNNFHILYNSADGSWKSSEIFSAVIPFPQKIVTFVDTAYIALGDAEANYPLYPMAPDSTYKGIMCNPMRNKTYAFEPWDCGNGDLRFYKGAVNEEAVHVYSTPIKNNDISVKTPDVDYDFAVINIRKNKNNNTEFRPANTISMSCVDEKDIENALTNSTIIPFPQKIVTFVDTAYIALGDAEANYPLYPMAPDSTYKGIMCNPMRNKTYAFEPWDCGDGDLRFYKGAVNEEAVHVYSTPIKNYDISVKTPDVDYDFAVINIRKNKNNYTEFRPTNTISMSCVDEKDIENEYIAHNNHWRGKKVCILGTSVAYGSAAEKAYAKIASNRLGFEVIPAVVPGLGIHAKIDSAHGNILAPLYYGSTCLSKAEYIAAKNAGATNIQIQSSPMPASGDSWVPGDDSGYNDYYRTWENVFNTKTDLWVFATGPNNTNFALDDWNAFDKLNWKYSDNSSFESHRTTFLGAMLYLMDKMYALGNDQRMVLVIDSAFSYEQVKAAFELLSNQWSIPIIDLWGKINTSPKSLLALKSHDGTDNHPSTFGQEKLGDIFTNELLLIS